MLDKIKNIGEAAKNVMLYILAPLLVLLSGVFFLWKREKDLEDQVQSKDGEIKLKEIEGEKKQVDSSSNDLVNSYERLYSRYNAKVSGGSDSLRSSGSGPKGPDSNSG